MHINFPWQIDERGETETTPDPEYVRDLIEQVLFTAPGERVMRPEFGSGARDLVFEPNSEELAAATEYSVRSALERYLGDFVELNGLGVDSEGATLRISVRYRLANEDRSRVETFERET